VEMSAPTVVMNHDARYAWHPTPGFSSFPLSRNDYFQTMVNITDHQSVVAPINGVSGQWNCPECVANNLMFRMHGNPIHSAFGRPVKAIVPAANVRASINVATVTNIKSSEIPVKPMPIHDTTSVKPSKAKITCVKRSKVQIKNVNSPHSRVKKKANFRSNLIRNKRVTRRGPYFLPPWALFVQQWGMSA